MNIDFTVEEKAFILSVNEPVKMERIQCIQAIMSMSYRLNADDKVKAFMNRVTDKLGQMDDREYASYDFSVDFTDAIPEDL